jgi:hypothetical protein
MTFKRRRRTFGEEMMTQSDMDEWDKLEELVRYGTRLGQHPRDTNLRYWWGDEHGGCWLYHAPHA